MTRSRSKLMWNLAARIRNSILLVGRELQRSYGQESQVVLTTPILEGLDGVQKMSKSLGNAIGIHEAPLEMYGKVMSISDEMMWRYYELLTDVSLAEIEGYKKLQHPMDSKKELASRIVGDFHSPAAAAAASEDWTKQFQFRQTPQAIEDAQVNYEDIAAGWSQGIPIPVDAPIKVDKLVYKVGLATSITDASKKRTQRAVKIDDIVILDPIYLLGTANFPKLLTLQLGRKYKQVLIRGPLAP